MANVSLKVSTVTDDPNHVMLTIAESEQKSVCAMLVADEVEALIRELAAARARAEPIVDYFDIADALPTDQHIPLFAVDDRPELPGKALNIRHEGIGWVSYVFRDQEAEVLANALLRQR
jgi:hypothetical protein